MLKQKKKVPFRVILRLPTVLGTVKFATTVLCGIGLKKSLLGNMRIDYCSDMLQVLNMRINRK